MLMRSKVPSRRLAEEEWSSLYMWMSLVVLIVNLVVCVLGWWARDKGQSRGETCSVRIDDFLMATAIHAIANGEFQRTLSKP